MDGDDDSDDSKDIGISLQDFKSGDIDLEQLLADMMGYETMSFRDQFGNWTEIRPEGARGVTHYG